MAERSEKLTQADFRKRYSSGIYEDVFDEPELDVLSEYAVLERDSWDVAKTGDLDQMLSIAERQIELGKTPEFKSAKSKIREIEDRDEKVGE